MESLFYSIFARLPTSFIPDDIQPKVLEFCPAAEKSYSTCILGGSEYFHLFLLDNSLSCFIRFFDENRKK